MPYRKRKKQLGYLREYGPAYRAAHADEIAARQAQWFRDNQESAVRRRRRNRALERARPAVEDLPGRWREVILAAVRAWAEIPDLEPAALAALVRSVPDGDWSHFLERLGPRDRARWESVRA
jgi:hypothetical protein